MTFTTTTASATTAQIIRRDRYAEVVYITDGLATPAFTETDTLAAARRLVRSGFKPA